MQERKIERYNERELSIQLIIASKPESNRLRQENSYMYIFVWFMFNKKYILMPHKNCNYRITNMQNIFRIKLHVHKVPYLP